ncbi:MAG: aspartate aminotransferase family protein [Flavobacteriales bacterium CG03_land_8_20_14_0_80_35_15]|nr:aminotransferase class III-fold pyridoxal phosphate-dependent enzyme [Zetaproteobacteria bacterium]OIO12598.1 MAG: aspartate aminotransferase family protein [Flavobacteriaceae bacterium CG1_02_35_72]PIV16057.1 MAG: aspartate aminotransferase family protein [Flavobacteriales bacterium CG03_land_8_20_14_0_80_35_15]PIX07363.1 MAG: aspartate aminotransferase family protein [Flavobacteriales bacterium CG_4_8_14_3_um_filter_35_10]PJA05922.1 MAG: aspartate aminotransferase family protein [Flavobact
MDLFKVYPLYNVKPVKAKGVYVYDENNTKYLDLYGGHGVISIGHSHKKYVARLSAQLKKIGFYSNSVQNPLQVELAQKLGSLSGCENYQLFLCNSGAEANENALKLASFKTGKSRVIAFNNSFHGRTSAAVAVTDNPFINAPINRQQKVTFLPLNNSDLVTDELKKGDVAAVIIEGIQGVGGLDEGTTAFFKELEKACQKRGVFLILDEVQSGYGRSGEFFAFQHHHIKPDIITTAKGMGNGFPIGGVLISNKIEPKFGMLGTTFGGNHLACTAAISVLEIMESENLIAHVNEVSNYFLKQIKPISQIKKVKGKGLMLGLEFDFEVAELRKKLIMEKHIFTGGSNNKKLLRILPPLSITKNQINKFVIALKTLLDE